MSATRIILKRSSILGKRPNTAVIEPGELALNTNSTDPGVFFEVSNGEIVKAGPVAYLPQAPTSTPARGESWLDTQTGTLKIGDAKKQWQTVAAPFLGGSDFVVFVAPEFPFSSDALLNNGQSLPFQTVTRAILELTKVYISNVLSGYASVTDNTKYTVYYAPSRLTANNGPGQTVSDFNVSFADPYKQVTISDLEQFNTVDGGIIVPHGFSVVGLDLKKCEVRPTYVPTYKNPSYPSTQFGVNQPLSSIFKLSGNSYINNFSISDKLDARDIYKVTVTSPTNLAATFYSTRPHGLDYNEQVTVTFAASVNQSTGTFTQGTYYAVPIDTFTFQLSSAILDTATSPAYVTFASMPVFASNNSVKLTVTNSLYSAHRLSNFRNASFQELADFYTKVQKAFTTTFGGQVTDGAKLVSTGEYVIVGPTDTTYPNNSSSNTVRNSSAYLEEVNLRSQYGMCAADFDGDVVQGFRSAILNQCTAISIQNDPSVYEIYTTLVDPDSGQTLQKWWTLTEATYLSLPLATRPASIVDTSVADQLALLNRTDISNIRYWYLNLTNSQGKSFGIVDIDNDFRHFGYRARNGAYIQAGSVYTIGPAIGVWALNGGLISLTNSTSNFGSVAIKAEGFRGINTIGGAEPNGAGFLFDGIQTPLSLSRSQVENTENKEILTLGSKIVSVSYETGNESIQIVELSQDFSPCYLLPFSLVPGTAIWVATEECTYRGFLATDGGPTIFTGAGVATNASLRIRASDSTIPTDATLIPALGIPYIRRFRDPRSEFDRSYSFVVRNTYQYAVAPQVGSVLRLNQTSQSLGTSTLKPNYQFDPGTLGGWGRVFTVDAAIPGVQGTSPQFNYVIGDSTQDSSYFLSITVSDYSRPWEQEFNNASGYYATYANRNWYSAENNTWKSVYYDTTFTASVGPEKVAPVETCSPFITTSVLERQDLTSTTYQGNVAPDPYLATYDSTSTYFRGATVPYTEFAPQLVFDGDDSSESLGLCLKSVPSVDTTQLVTAINASSVVQTSQTADRATNRRYRPEIVEFSVLSAVTIPSPKQQVVVVALTSGSATGTEYLRVIGQNGSVIQAIRLNNTNSLYPNPTTTSASPTWPVGSVVTVCATNATPDAKGYDPDWSNSKQAVLRFFEVMGYSNSVTLPLLSPNYWGSRFIPVTTLPISPAANGYASVTGQWPLEFNRPSAVLANTHTWAYSGFLNYSRGLPDYQTNLIPRKLGTDYQATTTWGGRLAVTGVNDQGEVVLLGPERSALTAQLYQQVQPTITPVNQQLYEAQGIVEFPNQVIVYSTDNISSQFDGLQNTFDLLRGGLVIPSDQLTAQSIFVNLGGVTQIPTTDYTINTNQITFINAPLTGTTCDIRVVTTQDSQKTLVVVPMTISPAFDNVTTIFTATSPSGLTATVIDNSNTFLFLGGVEQIPGVGGAYTITRVGTTSSFQIVFTGAPLSGSSYDLRAITTGTYWASRLAFPVEVYSIDDISPQFNGALTDFTLTKGGVTINPEVVNTQNLFVSLGGAMQLPTTSYSVQGSKIIFTAPPIAGTSSNLRIVTNAEFITCPQLGLSNSFVRWGPGLLLDIVNQITGIDPGTLE